MQVSEHDCRRVAAEAELDARTVIRVLRDGRPSRSVATYTAIELACEKLGIVWHPSQLSPEPTPKKRSSRKARR